MNNSALFQTRLFVIFLSSLFSQSGFLLLLSPLFAKRRGNHLDHLRFSTFFLFSFHHYFPVASLILSFPCLLRSIVHLLSRF